MNSHTVHLRDVHLRDVSLVVVVAERASTFARGVRRPQAASQDPYMSALLKPLLVAM